MNFDHGFRNSDVAGILPRPRTTHQKIFFNYSVATRFAKIMARGTGETSAVRKPGAGWEVRYKERQQPYLIGGLVTAEYYKRRITELGLPFDGYFGRKPEDAYGDEPEYF